MLFTIVELQRAATWAAEHARVAHQGKLDTAEFALRHFGTSGVGQNTLVMCELCERVPGKAGNPANHMEITDYAAW